MTTNDTRSLRAERDALAILGLLAHAYLHWDPPIAAGKDSSGNDDFTHFLGLNIHALVIDNIDGEVIALERNRIHEFESPVVHAEQLAVRTGNARLRAKRPRERGTVEQYYRSQLFYGDGATLEDFTRVGATLYSTLEPCPMCASTLLVCRMKRVRYFIEDTKFGGAWGTDSAPGLKQRFYPKYQLEYGRLDAERASEGGWIEQVATHVDVVREKIAAMQAAHVQDTWMLDRLHDELRTALSLLVALTPDQLRGEGADHRNLARTLGDLKRICRLPG